MEMLSISNDAVQSAIELNETVVFEYDANNDVINFSENIFNYIPIAARLIDFVKQLDKIGKIHEDDIETAIKFFTSKNIPGKSRMEYVRFIDLSGNYRWYQLKGRAGRSSDGVENFLFGSLSYIDDDKKQFDEERALTKIGTTGLITSDVVFNGIDEYLMKIPADVIPVLLCVEIDDYEEFVGKYGEIIGAGVQLELARILQKTFRKSDLIGQVDAKRFLVFMKGVHGANIVLERSKAINRTVNDFYAAIDDARSVTVSIGAAIMHPTEATSVTLYDKSVAALEDAIEHGKNTYIVYSEDMERIDSSVNPLLSTKEMELVRNILDPISTWAYSVDVEYNLLYKNAALSERLEGKCNGKCYKLLKGYDEPCSDCPITKFDDKAESCDCVIYSPSLRIPLPMRSTKIIMRDGRPIFVMAAVNENVDAQIEIIKEAENRITEGLYSVQDLIWDINITKNTVIRIKERNIGSLMDLRVTNYKKLINFYVENVVHPEDRVSFQELTDSAFIKRTIMAGKDVISREIRVKNTRDEYEWMGCYTVLLNKKDEETLSINKEDDIRVMIFGINVNDYKKMYIETIETKIKYETMREKSNIMKDMALSFERHENVNEMIGILVYEYTVADANYYLCSSFDDIFDIDKANLKDEWSVLTSLNCIEADKEIFDEFLKNLRTSNLVERVTLRLLNKYGVYVWYTITVQVLRGLNNEPVRYLGTFQNVDTEMKIKSEMEYRADYDSLTDVYNSEAFYRRVREIINNNTDKNYAIFSIDIDKFRLINDSMGIEMGNKLLASIGEALKRVTNDKGVVKRYQADIFSTLVAYDDDQDLVNYMTETSTVANELNPLSTPISFTFGIFKIQDRDLQVRLMCDRARAAKKQLKGSSSASNYAVYDDTIRLKLKEQVEIEEQMEKALANNEFVMFLQPQIRLKNGKISGAEALVRWKHPIKGIMVPFQFLDLFESNGFIIKLDKFMWEEACKYLKNLKDRGINIPIAVNISRAHIGVTDLSKEFLALTKKYDIEPSRIELEITENLFMDNVDELFGQMSSLKQNGFSIHMDDFGSAYSSLNMLRNAPVDTLKIDKFFFDEIMTTERGKIIVESSVRMAKQLGLTTIAEGVETVEQLEFLSSIDCDIVQGYYYSRPVDIEKFEAFMGEYL